MKTSIRKEGTRVFTTEDNQDKIGALQFIVRESQYAVINGRAVDLFTASAVLSVYDALSDKNKERYIKSDVPMMAKIAFQLLSEKSEVSR